MSDPYGFGRDLSCLHDLSPTMDEIEGVEVLEQDLVHRLQTPRGQLVDDADYGKDAASLMSEGLSPLELAGLPRQLEAELRKEDRVSAVTSESTRVDAPDGVSLRTRFKLTTAAGPFRFTADISAAGVLVSESAAPR